MGISLDEDELPEHANREEKLGQIHPAGVEVSICLFCIHKQSGGVCKAFPDGIPDVIRFRKFNHLTPYPGDNGIMFELSPRLVAPRQLLRLIEEARGKPGTEA